VPGRGDPTALALILLALAGAGGCQDPPASAADHAEPTAPVEAVAELARATGDVRWQRGSGEGWIRVAPGKDLRPGEAVQTMARATATVTFVGDGAEAELDPLTTLRIPDQAPRVARLSHLHGRLAARLDPAGDVERVEVRLPPGTLVLERGQGEGASEGVEARVDVGDGQTAIAMVRGTGQMRRDDGTLEVAQGRFLDLADDGRIVDEGRLGPPVTPLSPGHGDRMVVRRTVAFQWEPLPRVEGYRLELVGPDGGERRVDVPADQSSVDLAVSAGPHRWTVRAIRDGGPLPAHAPRRFEVEVDRVPPMLVLHGPEGTTRVGAPTVRLAGRTEPAATVEVDGVPVAVAPNGQFSVNHPVQPGLSNVIVRARDRAGNVRTTSRMVLRP
jgi:hypothetical protein